MPQDFINATYSGLDNQIKRSDKIKLAVGQPDINVMARAMAGVWQSNFTREGAAVGGWRPLTEATNDLRQSRGYPREHPILVQTGALRRAAIESLLNVNGPRLMTGKGVMMSYQPALLGASFSISGPKVDNQFRVRDRRSGISSPPRPFWFVNNAVSDAAANALSEWISAEIA